MAGFRLCADAALEQRLASAPSQHQRRGHCVGNPRLRCRSLHMHSCFGLLGQGRQVEGVSDWLL